MIEIGTYDIQVALTHVIDGFLGDHEDTVKMIQGHVGDQEGTVGLHHCCGNPEDRQI